MKINLWNLTWNQLIMMLKEIYGKSPMETLHKHSAFTLVRLRYHNVEILIWHLFRPCKTSMQKHRWQLTATVMLLWRACLHASEQWINTNAMHHRIFNLASPLNQHEGPNVKAPDSIKFVSTSSRLFSYFRSAERNALKDSRNEYGSIGFGIAAAPSEYRNHFFLFSDDWP